VVRTAPASKGSQMTAPGSEALGSTAAEAGTTPEPGPLPPPFEPGPEEPVGRGEAFDACVEDLRRWIGSSTGDLLSRLQDVIRWRLGVPPLGPGAAMLAGLTGSGIRLLAALLAAVLFGQWTGIPWGRWGVILGFYLVVEASDTFIAPPRHVLPPPSVRRIVEDWTALLPTIVRESDLRELAEFTHRWYRLPRTVATGVAVAATTLLACALFAPGALSELPAGSIVLLAWLLYDFGTIPVYWGNLFNWAMMAREARYDHHLFWPSPADSPEVHKMMRKTTSQAFAAGWWITVFLVMTVVLVSWDSPLVLPLAVGFVAIGYLSTIGLAVSNRASVRKIIERSRQERLAMLRSRIDVFGPRCADLTPQESERLRDLLFLHNEIRDAPSSPTAAGTVLRTAAALTLPTIMFVVTVFGEVSAERILDALLP
jgi:hypothetical protein